MSVEISFGYIVHWDKFEREFTIPLTDLFMKPFWGRGIAEFPEGYESSSVRTSFLECCFQIGRRCPPDLKQQLQTVFRWGENQGDWTEPMYFDAPFHEAFVPPSAELWGGLASAFDPESVASLCRVADLMRLNDCRPFFRPSKRIRSFDHFCDYAQSWIEQLREAQSINAGVVIFYT